MAGVGQEDDDGNKASQKEKAAIAKPQPKKEVKGLEDLIRLKAKDHFTNKDDFNVWLVDNGFDIDLSKISEFDKARVLNKLGEFEK